MRAFFVSVGCALVVATVLGAPAYAQPGSNNTLTVGPSVTDISLAPGEVSEKRFTAANQGKEKFTLQLSVAPYAVTNEQYEATFEPIPGRIPVQEWIDIPGVDTMVIEAGKYYDVNFRVRVPEGTPAGGYSAVILAESTVDKIIRSGVQIRNRIAHIVYITVEGDAKQAGYVNILSSPLFAIAGTQQVRYTAINEGGSNEKVSISTKVTDVFGREVFSSTVQRYVLPSTKRTLDVTWPSNSFFGIYKVTAQGEIADTPKTSSKWVVITSPLFILCLGAILLVIIWRYTVRFNKVKQRKR